MPDDQLTLQELSNGCAGKLSAIRSRIRLQPVAGPGEKVFPATHLKGAYAEETRRVPNGNGGFRPSKVVIIDSIQSQANRLEQALLQAVEAGEVRLPLLYVELCGRKITALDAPHRIYDAFFWDAMVDGQSFRDSQIGTALVQARPWSAQALYAYAPTVLLFGGWDSRGGGMQNARFARAVESEIVALDAEVGVRSASRICPIGIRGVTAYKGQTEPYTFDQTRAAVDSKGKPATVEITQVGHSNIPPTVSAGGVTAAEIVQTAAISLTRLRQYKFGSEPVSVAARTVIAALGLFAITRQLDAGYDLRSRCHLVPMCEPIFDLIGKRAGEVRSVRLDSGAATSLFLDAVEQADAAGLKWNDSPMALQPNERLVELVRLSERAGAEPEQE